MNQEAEYLWRRELRELRMARRARCPRARGVHRHLASVYASRRAAIDPHGLRRPSRWAAFVALVRGVWRGGGTVRHDAGAHSADRVDSA